MNQTHASERPLHSQRATWHSPRLRLLGDVSSLTETGSAATNESPINACQQSINNVGNTCMG